jgi:hypothetical protein
MWNPFKRAKLSLSVENSWTFHCEGSQEAVEGFYAHWLNTLAESGDNPQPFKAGFQPNDLGTVETATEIAACDD